ncbi:aldehyde dehydrogenase family protein [Streptomyces sp. NPDC057695]|uniref:aldehyde dehydrogenase family protein n=1 Tax=Streptomyces sp. NPDC057695 TaxID=3346217 RepID=UPI003686B556
MSRFMEEDRPPAARSAPPAAADSLAPPDAVREPRSVVSEAAEAGRRWVSARASVRARALSAVAEALESARAELVAIGASETGWDEARLDGDLTRATFHLRVLAGRLRGRKRATVPATGRDEHRPDGPEPVASRVPVGGGPLVVVPSAALPFSSGVVGTATASAWAAGRSVVAVGVPEHPALTRRVAGIARDALAGARAPEGVFELLDDGTHTVEALRHPEARAVAFTGSERVGRALARVVSGRQRPVPFHAEQDGLDPVIVTPGAATAHAAEIAEGCADALTLRPDRSRTGPLLVFVPAAHGLVYEIAWRARKVSAPSTDEDVAEQFLREASRLTALTGARRLVWSRDASEPRLLVVDATALSPGAARECFAPLGLVVLYVRLSDVAGPATALAGQRPVTLYAETREREGDGELAGMVADLTRRGADLRWNRWPASPSLNDTLDAWERRP